MKKIIFFIVFVMMIHPAWATVTIDINTGALRTSTNAIISNNTTCILVADPTGFSSLTGLESELSGVTLGVGNLIGDGKIIAMIGATDLSGFGDYGYNANLSAYDFVAESFTGANSPSTAGTDLAIFWFPGLFGSSPQLVSDGESFGFFRSDTIDVGSQSFNMPGDGATTTIYAFDTNLGGGYDPSDFIASGVVGAVPEPSMSILSLLGTAAAFLRRRRR